MSPQTSGFTAHHSTFQELSDFFKTLKTLEANKKEKWIQARWVSTTLLAASSSDTINPELLRALGFDPKKAPATILPDAETVSMLEDLVLDSDQQPARTRTGNPQATTVVYSQSHPETI